MNKRRAVIRGLLALGGAQFLLYAGFVVVERRRAAKPQAMRVALPPLWMRRSGDGGRVSVARAEALMLLHVWASWCPPCREELPALLEFARREGVALIAAAMDGEVEAIRPLFDAAYGEQVFFALEGFDALPVRSGTLPMTFLVEGREIIGVFYGQQNWKMITYFA